MTKALTRLRQDEYNKVASITDEQYKNEFIGQKPRRGGINPFGTKGVWNELHNPNETTFVQWFAVILLLFAMMFSIFKSINPSIDFANGFASIQGFNPVLHQAFLLVTIVTNALIVSTGLIYTTMQATDPLTLKTIKENPLYIGRSKTGKGMHPEAQVGDSKWRMVTRFLSLEAITPRLWQVLTYFVMLWLFAISNHGEGDWVIKFLPVIIEIALAHTVIQILNNWRIHAANVDKVLTLQVGDWNIKFANRHRNPDYLPLMYQNLREALALTRRTWTRTRVNAWMDTAPTTDVDDVVLTEYLRLTAGIDFASGVAQNSITTAGKGAAIVEGAAPLTASTSTAIRIPPNGSAYWTVKSLMTDFEVFGLSKTAKFNQNNISALYGNKYKARKAYRSGAKDYFTTAKEA